MLGQFSLSLEKNQLHIKEVFYEVIYLIIWN